MQCIEKENVLFRDIIDKQNIGVCILDNTGIILYANPACERLTGIPMDFLLGKSIFSLSQKESENPKTESIYSDGTVLLEEKLDQQQETRRKFFALLVKKFSQEGKPGLYLKDKASISGYITADDDTVFYFYIVAYPIFHNDGHIRHIVLNMYDPPLMRLFYQCFTNEGRYGSPMVIDNNFDENYTPLQRSSSPDMANIEKIIQRVSKSDATVLISGESGVGKEVIADNIYHNSSRQGNPYIKVNCSAMPANLLESELFGYEGGAFTGARPKGKAGLFELANHGTIFLDEIGELSYEAQAKLLRVLQNHEIMRIGGSSIVKLDIRVLAATNQDLRKMIAEGKFREDLFYRLNVVPIHVPPLRERKGDIPRLASLFLDKFCKRYKREMHITEDFVAMIQDYSWPGNIRELENALEYLILCTESPFISAEDFLTFLHSSGGGIQAKPSVIASNIFIGEEGTEKMPPELKLQTETPQMSLQDQVKAYEKALIEETVLQEGSLRKAAAKLQVNVSTVARKVKQYQLNLPEEAK